MKSFTNKFSDKDVTVRGITQQTTCWDKMNCMYLLYGTTALVVLWLPSNEGFFIWFNFSYTYFLLFTVDKSISSWANYIGTKVLLGHEFAD